MDKYNLLRLEEILDVYGASTERWPEGERGELLSLVQSDGAAKRLFQEAQALEGFLDTPMQVEEASSEALFQSIMGQVDELEGTSQNVIELKPHLEAPKRDVKEEQPFLSRYRWEMGAMAASLMIGLFLGLSDVSPMLLGSEFEIATISSEASDFLLLDDGLQDIF